jgi:hypothetical protein
MIDWDKVEEQDFTFEDLYEDDLYPEEGDPDE